MGLDVGFSKRQRRAEGGNLRDLHDHILEACKSHKGVAVQDLAEHPGDLGRTPLAASALKQFAKQLCPGGGLHYGFAPVQS